ncbi:iron-containing alcohol dehydrogenase [Halobacillus sp. A5]|uniref:iron-containing alcohol dehydrogenase n=1 Tax=Halobacillus sp. A5 TaxID=2880263 RepID=UPI0020A6A932|nr:iron-containing alcohol dehydrogenase [Halobacillus sp. A5]MCP3027125.1 iron-containing alcohol dehydrogenase [Halobacillus sp. A5]
MNAFVSPKHVYYGEGSLSKLPGIIQSLNVQTVLLITDPTLKELGVIDPVLDLLHKENIELEVLADVVPELPVDSVNEMVEKAREKNPDFVIGIGGGSAMDLAKAVAVLDENPGHVEDYLNLTGTRQLKTKGVPKLLIPTTAGTGAEVTDIAVFSLQDTKDVMTHEYLLADYAIVDPVLTYSLPEKVTAASGVDALTHAIEAYTSIEATPLTDSLALEAIAKISANLRKAVWNGKDKQAREQMALGSMIAGMSFYNAGVTGVHALAYPLGGLFKIPHGEANAVLLPYVYDYIWPSCLDKLADVAAAMKLPAEGKDQRTIARDVVQALYHLVEDVGLPTRTVNYNIQVGDNEALTRNGAKQTRLLNRSPMRLDEKAIQHIYNNAWQGSLTSIQ